MTMAYQLSQKNQSSNSLSTIMRLVRFDVLRSLGSWRWLLVLPIYGLVGSFYGSLLKFDFTKQQPRSINLWDVPPVVVSDPFMTVWFVALGFALLIGDSFVRDYTQNTLALTLSRITSRTAWWTAKMISISVLALCYVVLMFGSILIGSLFSVPFAPHDSPSSLIPTTGSDGWYYRLMDVPMPLFVLLVGAYVAFALWIIGAVVVGSSLMSQRSFIPFAVMLVWALVGRALRPLVLSAFPYGRLLDVSYFISYAKHLTPYEHTPFPVFLLVALSALVVITVVGAWQLHRIDI